jgi:hypothetical protein
LKVHSCWQIFTKQFSLFSIVCNIFPSKIFFIAIECCQSFIGRKFKNKRYLIGIFFFGGEDDIIKLYEELKLKFGPRIPKQTQSQKIEAQYVPSNLKKLNYQTYFVKFYVGKVTLIQM